MKQAPRSENKPETLVKNSMLYKEFLAQREEILRHKWLKSEEIGKDVGFEAALLDWMLRHRATWREERQDKAVGAHA